MLQFFRTYQRFFFLFTTVVIIISFSFFGTYSTLGQSGGTEPTAFTAIDGSEISRRELDELVRFLSTDAHDKRILGGSWGLNFLNDGVIRHDFCETGLAQMLLSHHAEEVSEELESRLQKEKRFQPYEHPQASFIHAEGAWGYFVPSFKAAYDTLRSQSTATSEEAIQARVKLYLEESHFPAPTLLQLLRYQEKQYNWVEPDPRLGREDLSLFRYHTAEDWFGSQFMKKVAQCIINASIEAGEKGYEVSREEALVDLLRASDRSYQEQLSSGSVAVAHRDDYFKEQLRRMGMNEIQAVKVWQKVLLFRRLFQDVAQGALMDTLAYNTFSEFAQAGVEVEEYRLPQGAEITRFADLQQLETYLQRVAKKSDPLDLPQSYLPLETLSEKAPELLQKRYTLQVAHVDHKELQSKVGIREGWQWQVSDEGWELLIERFTELGLKGGDTEEHRFAALEQMDRNTRQLIDQFTRASLVEKNPLWLEEALERSKEEPKEVSLRLEGGSLPFPGITDGKELMGWLDAAPLSGEELHPSLQAFSPDGLHTYRIWVLERSEELELLPFVVAAQEGILRKLLDKDLEAHYQQIRESKKELFQRENGSWKVLAEVRDTVAEDRFQEVLQALGEGSHEEKSLRRYSAHLALLREAVKRGETPFWREEQGVEGQWNLVPTQRKVSLAQEGEKVKPLFELEPGDFSEVLTGERGEPLFYRVTGSVEAEPSATMRFRMNEGYEALGHEAKRLLMGELLQRTPNHS